MSGPYETTVCTRCGTSTDRPAGSSVCYTCLGEPRPSNGKPDLVNHPPHYKSGGMEVIDVIEAFGLGFCLGNTAKYVLRAGRKTGESALTDLKKGRWYLDREIARLEKK